jgi:hypothetical protein
MRTTTVFVLLLVSERIYLLLSNAIKVSEKISSCHLQAIVVMIVNAQQTATGAPTGTSTPTTRRYTGTGTRSTHSYTGTGTRVTHSYTGTGTRGTHKYTGTGTRGTRPPRTTVSGQTPKHSRRSRRPRTSTVSHAATTPAG